MVITLLSWKMGQTIFINIWKDGILKQVVTFGILFLLLANSSWRWKNDFGNGTKKPKIDLTVEVLYKILGIIDFIRTHQCIATTINFEATKFCQILLHALGFPNINFNHLFYLMWCCHDHSQGSQISNLHVMLIIKYTNLVSGSIIAIILSFIRCKNEVISFCMH